MGDDSRFPQSRRPPRQQSYDVELVSVMRRVYQALLPPLPGGSRGHRARRPHPPAPSLVAGREALASGSCSGALPSTLMHPDDRWARLQPAERHQAGAQAAPPHRDPDLARPAMNLLAGLLDPPGLIKIGQEHMHWGRTTRACSRDARPVQEARRFRRAHRGRARGLRQAPEGQGQARPDPQLRARARRAGRPEREAGPVRRPPDAQKGFDWLIPAWAQVEAEHPDWELKSVARAAGASGSRLRWPSTD